MALAQDPITGKTPLETSMCLLLFGIGGSWALQGEAETFLRPTAREQPASPSGQGSGLLVWPSSEKSQVPYRSWAVGAGGVTVGQAVHWMSVSDGVLSHFCFLSSSCALCSLITTIPKHTLAAHCLLNDKGRMLW